MSVFSRVGWDGRSVKSGNSREQFHKNVTVKGIQYQYFQGHLCIEVVLGEMYAMIMFYSGSFKSSLVLLFSICSGL